MTRFLPLLLLGALLVPLTPSATAQSPYTVAWPDDGEPIWEMDVVRPSQSTGPDGSGLEIRDVHYNGYLVMKRGHVPLLNVKYEAGCNCFRDWQDSEVRFEADNPIPGTPWVAEATPGTVQTMCDAAPDNCSGNTCNDVGSHRGVAVERFDDRLVLTTQLSAGWYRYTMRWVFHEDGTIEPLFGFTSTGTACTTNPRRHHAYWRFDFDIDGAENDYVLERRAGQEDLVFDQETSRIWQLLDADPTTGTEEDHFGYISWAVMDSQSERGYLLTPGRNDFRTPVDPQTGIPALDNFAKEDAVVSLYKPNELDDGDWSCEADFTGGGSTPVINGENVYDTDVVLWYRSGVTKPHSDASTCYESGPVLKPVGDWGRAANAPTPAEDTAAPARFTLDDPYPNPFDGTTTIRFSVESAQPVTLTLYDSVGREIRTLYAGTPSAGTLESVVIDGTNLPSGVYTVRIEGEGISAGKRITLVK